MPIGAVTFDLWLTLIWDSKELEEYRRLRRLVNFYRFVKKVRLLTSSSSSPPPSQHGSPSNIDSAQGSRFSYSDVRLALESLQVKAKELYDRGFDIHPKERGRMLFEILQIKVPKDVEEALYERAGNILSNSGYFSRFPSLNPEALPTMKLLKRTFPRVKIALISNAARSARAYQRMLKALGIGDYFDHLVISCEVGYLKPRKEIFRKALSLLSVEPSEALHVGDLFKADIVGAVACKMNACLYTGLWHKYAQYTNPGEHIPQDFALQHPGIVVKEIERLQDVVKVAKLIP